MKYFAIVILTSLFTIAGCASKPAPATTTTNANQAAPAAAAPPAPENLSPLQTINSLSAASKSKDVGGIKRRLNNGTLALFEETADGQGITVDELLTRKGGAPLATMADARNEKIEGEKAFVDVQDATTESYETIPLVKENGEWKVALDIYMETLRQRLTDEMKKNPHRGQVNPAPVKP